MRRVPIRMKLAAALAIPLLALVGVTLLEVVATAADVDEIRSQTQLAKSSTGPAGVITTLQNERTWPAVELIGNDGVVTVPTEGYDLTRRETDQALEAFRTEIERTGGVVASVYEPAIDELDALDQLRADIDADTRPRDLLNIPFADEIYGRYSELIHTLLDANSRVTLQIDDPELRLGTELVDLTSQQIELLADLSRRTIVTSTLSEGGIDTPDEIKSIATLQAEFARNNANVQTARGPYADVVAEHYPADLTDTLTANVDAALVTGSIQDLDAFLADLDVPRDEGWQGFRDRVVTVVNARADEVNRAAEARERWYIALAGATLLAATATTWLVSRSITKPLRLLTGQAKEMAESRLPEAVLDILETPLGDDVRVPHIEPVAVQTRDEVGDVVEALNTVQDSALDLAVEQAVLRRNIADSFVNLGRRNQNLLGRQLDFITELESNETDPDTLASLFRLDHLATRMRRNAESLLVLAGIDPPRKWAAPVRLSDVIRAALGEVEDYQRVTVRNDEPATIIGSAAADLAHLIAEFIENALTFSPPDQNVEIRGRHRPDGRGFSLAIIDAGLGMPPSDIVQANRRLAGTESFTVAPSKYLGHYVAGNLAARHGIRLQLDNSPGHGVTATIDIPASVLTSDTPGGDPITDPHALRAVRPGHPGLDVGPLEAGPPDQPALPEPRRGQPPDGYTPEPVRTVSGLAKRSPRGPGRSGGRGPAPAVPSGDLLAALSDHASKLGRHRPSGPAGTPSPAAPAAPAGPPGVAARGPGGSGAVPAGSFAAGQPGGPWGPGTPDGPSAPGGPPPGGAWGPPDPAGPGGPWAPGGAAPGGAWGPPDPAGPGRPFVPGGPPLGRTGSPGRPPLGGRERHDDPVASPSASSMWASLGTPARPGVHAPPGGTGAPPLGQSPAAPGSPPDPSAGGTTQGGLTRRVRGAQMPSTQPLSLRRSGVAAGPPPGRAAGQPQPGVVGRPGPGGPPPGRGAPPPAASPAPGPAPGRRRSSGERGEAPASDVYGFLSSFTSGVQRGLDEARGADDGR